MTRYLDVGKSLARRVRSGELPAGAELPTVRECARDFATTATTITRAYRYLADGGVITLADRRRATVATRGAMAAARLLEQDDVFRLAGSDDPALQLLMEHVAPAITNVGTRGSFWALRTLSRGEADGAAIHLRHRSGDYNAPFARALSPRPGPTPHPAVEARAGLPGSARQPGPHSGCRRHRRRTGGATRNRSRNPGPARPAADRGRHTSIGDLRSGAGVPPRSRPLSGCGNRGRCPRTPLGSRRARAGLRAGHLGVIRPRLGRRSAPGGAATRRRPWAMDRRVPRSLVSAATTSATPAEPRHSAADTERCSSPAVRARIACANSAIGPNTLRHSGHGCQCRSSSAPCSTTGASDTALSDAAVHGR